MGTTMGRRKSPHRYIAPSVPVVAARASTRSQRPTRPTRSSSAVSRCRCVAAAALDVALPSVQTAALATLPCLLHDQRGRISVVPTICAVVPVIGRHRALLLHSRSSSQLCFCVSALPPRVHHGAVACPLPPRPP